ncbi:hypothetical protein BSL82_11585 [Tardibacter chloracetimidivorans]|uniref:Uncharacterized protein n=1 Tax=Tardibacter chloracetimidivorans TaxID=1921510 RepID=A0A1L3ZW69_9SPHN|nr:hypothetical protein [Tardibacter chloracetimidivorans]API59877.1 hypothetical protein BSL82_11585 [Tardibacter chloracetimidivorans]
MVRPPRIYYPAQRHEIGDRRLVALSQGLENLTKPLGGIGLTDTLGYGVDENRRNTLADALRRLDLAAHFDIAQDSEYKRRRDRGAAT